jgi:putative oxidoreductase
MRLPAATLLLDARPWFGDGGLLLLRLLFGLGMAILHGWSKLPVSEDFIRVIREIGIPAPAVLAWAAVLTEFLGGLLICLGLLTRPAALGVLCTMLVAVFIRYAGRPLDERELALLYSTACVALLFTGPGRYSLDHWLAGRAVQPAASLDEPSPAAT